MTREEDGVELVVVIKFFHQCFSYITFLFGHLSSRINVWDQHNWLPMKTLEDLMTSHPLFWFQECTQVHGSLSVVDRPKHGKELKGGRETIWYLLIAIASQ